MTCKTLIPRMMQKLFLLYFLFGRTNGVLNFDFIKNTKKPEEEKPLIFTASNDSLPHKRTKRQYDIYEYFDENTLGQSDSKMVFVNIPQNNEL